MAEIPLVFVKISDPSITTVRVVNNYEDKDHGGHTYTAYPFQITFPSDMPDQLPSATITIDNVGRLLIDEIRTLQNAPDVEIFAALASDPDTIEAGPFEMTLREVTYDAMTIVGKITELDIFRETYPGDNYSPTNTPGLFKEV